MQTTVFCGRRCTARALRARRNSENRNGTTRRSSRASSSCGASSRRSEEHTSELQSRGHLVCRLLLEKKKKKTCHVTILPRLYYKSHNSTCVLSVFRSCTPPPPIISSPQPHSSLAQCLTDVLMHLVLL